MQKKTKIVYFFHFLRCRHLKPVLWKKETVDEDSMYVNPYARIHFDYPDDVQQWKDILNDLSSPKTAQESEKSNNRADQMIQQGHTEFQTRSWSDALNSYSRALCFAERGTMYEVMSTFLEYEKIEQQTFMRFIDYIVSLAGFGLWKSCTCFCTIGNVSKGFD